MKSSRGKLHVARLERFNMQMKMESPAAAGTANGAEFEAANFLKASYAEGRFQTMLLSYWEISK